MNTLQYVRCNETRKIFHREYSRKLPRDIQMRAFEKLNAIDTTHPIKSERPGEVVDVEPGEADWNLDVLEALFNYYFVQPATIKKKQEILNLKLKEVDKKGMKKA